MLDTAAPTTEEVKPVRNERAKEDRVAADDADSEDLERADETSRLATSPEVRPNSCVVIEVDSSSLNPENGFPGGGVFDEITTPLLPLFASIPPPLLLLLPVELEPEMENGNGAVIVYTKLADESKKPQFETNNAEESSEIANDALLIRSRQQS